MMDVNLTRIPDDGGRNRCRITLLEGSIEIVGTGGFVTGVLKAVLQPSTIVSHLILEHVDPETLRAAWDDTADAAGLAPE